MANPAAMEHDHIVLTDAVRAHALFCKCASDICNGDFLTTVLRSALEHNHVDEHAFGEERLDLVYAKLLFDSIPETVCATMDGSVQNFSHIRIGGCF